MIDPLYCCLLDLWKIRWTCIVNFYIDSLLRKDLSITLGSSLETSAPSASVVEREHANRIKQKDYGGQKDHWGHCCVNKALSFSRRTVFSSAFLNLKICTRSERNPGKKGHGQCQETATEVKSKINLRLAKVEQNLSKQNMNKWKCSPFFYHVRVRVPLNAAQLP